MSREILQELRFQANQYWNLILRQYKGTNYFELSRIHVTADQELIQAEDYVGKVDFNNLAQSIIPILNQINPKLNSKNIL